MWTLDFYGLSAQRRGHPPAQSVGSAPWHPGETRDAPAMAAPGWRVLKWHRKGDFVGNGGKTKKKIVQQKSVSCAPNQKDSTLSLPEYLVIIPPRVVSLASAGVEYVDKVNPVNRLGFASSIWSQLIYDWCVGHKVIIEGTTKQYSDVLCMPVMHGKWYESEYVYDINMNIMHI